MQLQVEKHKQESLEHESDVIKKFWEKITWLVGSSTSSRRRRRRRRLKVVTINAAETCHYVRSWLPPITTRIAELWVDADDDASADALKIARAQKTRRVDLRRFTSSSLLSNNVLPNDVKPIDC